MRHSGNTFFILLTISVSVLTEGYDSLHSDPSKIPSIDSFDESRPILPKYDFIVIGAGAAGSVVANRLTENREWNVLVLENGEEENILTDIPVAAPVLSLTNSVYRYKSEPAKANKSNGFCLSYKNKRCPLYVGKAIGGSSVVNYMVYARGSPDEFNDWAELGNHGWTYEEILQYFKKSENCKIHGLDHRSHGYDGYLENSNVSYASSIIEPFLKAGEELGYKLIDYNTDENIGFSRLQATLQNGLRMSASKAFLRPIKKRRNFYLYKSSFVTRIVIDEKTKTAIGVEFIRHGRKYFVRASKEVILSAGALNTPKILMLSGIGPKDHLKSFNIRAIEDLPVGFDLQDHLVFPVLNFLIPKPAVSNILSVSNILNFYFKGTGPLTVPAGSEGLAFISTKAQDVKKDPNHQERRDAELILSFGSFLGEQSDMFRQSFPINDEFFDSVFAKYKESSGFTIFPTLLTPKSRGRVSLKSSDPSDDLIIDTNYLDHEDDVKILVNAIKKVVEIGSTKAFQSLNATLVPLHYPGCNHVEYFTDAFWSCLVRHTAGTIWHFCGTCTMSPREKSGVVDHRLKVHGIKSLRVVDNSIIPIITTGHLNAVAYMIAEKASDMIKEDWKFTKN